MTVHQRGSSPTMTVNNRFVCRLFVPLCEDYFVPVDVWTEKLNQGSINWAFLLLVFKHSFQLQLIIPWYDLFFHIFVFLDRKKLNHIGVLLQYFLSQTYRTLDFREPKHFIWKKMRDSWQKRCRQKGKIDLEILTKDTA